MLRPDPPRATGQLSPDGMWRWDGTRWQPEPSILTPISPPRISKRSWLATGGGIAALIAIPFIAAACTLPFVYYTDVSSGPASSSVFNLGYSGGLFFALEPIAVMVCVVIAGIFLIAWQHRAVRALGAGALLAFGVQTVTLFIGYIGGEVAYGRVGPGGPVGILGGLILLVGGGLAAAGLFVRQESQQETS